MRVRDRRWLRAISLTGLLFLSACRNDGDDDSPSPSPSPTVSPSPSPDPTTPGEDSPGPDRSPGPDDTPSLPDTAPPEPTPSDEDLDGDGYFTPRDCDDHNSDIYPGAVEVCNERDDDCDREVDEEISTVFYPDLDLDGYGDATQGIEGCGAPESYIDVGGDCNDADPLSYPGAIEQCDGLDNDCDGAPEDATSASTFYADQDGDGYGDPAVGLSACAPVSGYVDNDTDCNDADPAIHPDAEDVCDLIDNDCDLTVDEGQQKLTFFHDADGDTYGTSLEPVSQCVASPGYVEASGDCDDTNPAVNPAATEVCDTIDNNCTGGIDEGLTARYYQDSDGDGYGSVDASAQACGEGNGYVANAGDCDDTSANIYPGAPEVCDTADNDCDGTVDDGVSTEWFIDRDKDSFGIYGGSIFSCTQPVGYAIQAGDCDDNDATIYPEAPELCDDLDNDCDSIVDELEFQTYYADQDGDQYGDSALTISDCQAPTGYVSNDLDCNDLNATVYPDAPELCDGIDNDCDVDVDEEVDLIWYADADKDGYGDASITFVGCYPPSGYVPVAGDCNDNNAAINPSAVESCDDVDNNCDGAIDDVGGSPHYPDADGDGYGIDDGVLIDCSPLEGYASQSGDCDDSDASTYPGAVESCDEVDNNCNGAIDESGQRRWYRDQDQDGFGATDSYEIDCAIPFGYSSARGDCNDGDASIHPGADDRPNDGKDQDCGGGQGPEPHVGLSASSQQTLRQALDLATNGDVVWVGPGDYVEISPSLDGAQLTLISTEGAENTVVELGGQGFVINQQEGSATKIDGLTFTGMGVQLINTSPTFTGCHFSSHQGDDGAGLYLNNSDSQLTDCVFEDNQASGDGGGLYMLNSSPVLTRCIVRNNLSEGYGGGLYAVASLPTLDSCRFEGNTAGEGGGGLFLETSDAIIRDVYLVGNTAEGADGGGGAVFSDSDPLVYNLRAERNAAEAGGGLLLQGSNAQFSNLMLAFNDATYGPGGGLCILSSSPTITQAVISQNGSDSNGAGLYISGNSSSLVLQNSILAYNAGYNFYVLNGNTTSLTLRYNDFYNVDSTQNTNLSSLPANNRSSEPGFLSYVDGLPTNFHLATTSSLKDAATPNQVDVDGSRLDLGIYGGTYGDDWDMDQDGYRDYYWPGAWTQPPTGVSPYSFDCNDLDAAIQACQ